MDGSLHDLLNLNPGSQRSGGPVSLSCILSYLCDGCTWQSRPQRQRGSCDSWPRDTLYWLMPTAALKNNALYAPKLCNVAQQCCNGSRALCSQRRWRCFEVILGRRPKANTWYSLRCKHTKFDGSSFIRSRDISGVLNDRDHAPFRDGLSPTGCDLLWWTYPPNLKCYLDPLRKDERRSKTQKMGWFGMVMDHPRSLKNSAIR